VLHNFSSVIKILIRTSFQNIKLPTGLFPPYLNTSTFSTLKHFFILLYFRQSSTENEFLVTKNILLKKGNLLRFLSSIFYILKVHKFLYRGCHMHTMRLGEWTLDQIPHRQDISSKYFGHII